MSRMQISFTKLLVFGYGIILLVGLSLILYLSVAGAEQNTRQFQTYLVESTLASIQGQIGGHLGPVEENLFYLQTRIGQEDIAVDDPAALGLVFEGALASTPQVLALGFVHLDKQIIYATRGEIEIKTGRWQPSDDRQFGAFLERPPAGLTWLTPSWGSRSGRAVVPVVIPVYKEYDYVGLLWAAIDLEEIASFFDRVSKRVGFNVFALHERSHLLAYPNVQEISRVSASRDDPLLRLEDMNIPAMAQFWNPDRRRIKWLKSPGIEGHSLKIAGVKNQYFYQPLQDFNFPLILGVHLEQPNIPEWLQRLLVILAAGLLVIAVLLAFVAWMGRRIGGSVQLIVARFDTIGDEDIDQIQPLSGSRVVELDRISSAFNRMLVAMKEHQTVQQLFGQYVPKSIAQQLVAQRGVLEPQQTTATVLFCDMEGFTALSEQLDPPQIVSVLNSYFSDIGDILEVEGGLITQFQGDAVLAVFNVPTTQADHADRALRAAVAIHKLLSEREYGGYSLSCRVGINTGEVVAGIVGARERSNYTVHGDAVNLAARLEALNKTYNTRILVSEATIDCLQNGEYRRCLTKIGRVQVRGRQQQVGLYSYSDDSVCNDGCTQFTLSQSGKEGDEPADTTGSS